MAERDDKSEKETKTKIGVGSTQLERESRSRTQDQSQYAASAPEQDAGGYDDDYDDGDYEERARRDARDVGESVRQTGRTARRAGGDLLWSGCDLIGGIFIGIGEAISGRRAGGGSSSGGGSSDAAGNCVDELGGVCRGSTTGGEGGVYRRTSQKSSRSGPGGTRTSSRYELRRTR
jgi:hypothetical protein